VPGYEILEELGRGRMGVVYKAHHLRLNRPVALKVVLDELHAAPEDRVRFLGEAEALARCRHPHVIPVYEAGWHGGRPYLAMELAEGGTLARHCGGVAQPARQAARLVESLAGAVGHLHARGIVHRDLKPSNVLLTEGGVAKLADFGLAKRLGGGEGLTVAGALLGTPGYMAPEQALCRGVGPAADVYGLGAILYELLTGAPPFHGEGLLDTLHSVAHEPPPPPRRLSAGVPRDLEAVCLKCLQKEPRDRYATAEELADDLRRFLAGRPVLARPPSAWRRAVGWARRHPFAMGCCVGAAFGATTCLPGTGTGRAVAAVLCGLAYLAGCLTAGRIFKGDGRAV
jgi:serine/threonine-protein kinase